MASLFKGMGANIGISQQPSAMERAQDSGNQHLRSIKVKLGLEEKTEIEKLQDSLCPSLTYEQRLYGFMFCFGAGMLLSLSSMFSFTKLILGQPTDFAVKYTFGNCIAICSTGFLIGPMRQIKNMMAASRWIAALIYLGAMIMTLVSAFAIKIALVTVVFIVIQFCAMVWYCLSYIPFGRQMLSKCFTGMLDK